jgi:simple sugar transport system permease protein
VLGESESTARYAGMNVTAVLIIAMMLSGGLCGMAGVMQASAIEKTLTEGITQGLGFTSVTVAWLAKLNPIFCLVISFLFAMLIQGGIFIQASMQIPASIAEVLQALIIFFVLGGEFFLRYRFVWHRRAR